MDEYDVVVIGAGVGGYPAAIRASQLGLRTAIAEKGPLGGVCLNWGCIPSKALLRNAEVLSLFRRASEFGVQVSDLRPDFGAAVDRSRRVVDRLTKGVAYLLRKNRIDLVQGEALLTGLNTVQVQPSGQTLHTRNLILATGTSHRNLPGLTVDGQNVITSREALLLKDLPSSLAIVGAGATGVEFAYLYQTYGVQVSLIELLPHVLPAEDPEIADVLHNALERLGVKILLNTGVERIERQGSKQIVRLAAGGPPVEADKVLVAVGVQGNTSGLGLEKLGVHLEKSFVAVDGRMATNIPGIYAVGDITGKLLLAHVATAQGLTAAEAIAGRETRAIDYSSMPRAVYAQPQVGSMGLTEAQAREQGRQVKVGRFPFQASGKALAIGDSEGFVKLVVDAAYGEILGAHMVGHDVTEMLAEVSVAKALEGTHLEIGRTVHAHPSLSESLMEAALSIEGEAIHI